MNTFLRITAICCFLVLVNGHSKDPEILPESVQFITNHVRPIHEEGKPDNNALSQKFRVRRDVSGSLDIVTNNAQPIHAEVKTDTNADKVTPPNSDLIFTQSLRKSLPVTNKLDLIRSVNRIVLLMVFMVTAVVELYPTFAQLISTIYNFLLE